MKNVETLSEKKNKQLRHLHLTDEKDEEQGCNVQDKPPEKSSERVSDEGDKSLGNVSVTAQDRWLFKVPTRRSRKRARMSRWVAA